MATLDHTHPSGERTPREASRVEPPLSTFRFPSIGGTMAAHSPLVRTSSRDSSAVISSVPTTIENAEIAQDTGRNSNLAGMENYCHRHPYDPAASLHASTAGSGHATTPSLAAGAVMRDGAMSAPTAQNSVVAAGSAGAAVVRSSPWEVLQADSAASRRHADRVRQAKQLLHEYQRYQQEQQLQLRGQDTAQHSRSTSHGPRCSAGMSEGRWQDRGAEERERESWLPSHNVSAVQPNSTQLLSGSEAADSVMDTGNSMPQPQPQAQKQQQHQHDRISAACSYPTALSPTGAAVPLHNAARTHHHLLRVSQLHTEPSAQLRLLPLHPNAPPLPLPAPSLVGASSSARATPSDSLTAFDSTAFTVAKHRARQMLFYHARARAGFSEQSLSISRAVYKALLQQQPTAASPGTQDGPSRSNGLQGSKTPGGKTRESGAAGSRTATVGPSPAAQTSVSQHGTLPAAVAGAGSLDVAEADRALSLLTFIRETRRQTEELTVALLHACGEWECWADAPSFPSSSSPSSVSSSRPQPRPQQHLFADLFLHDATLTTTTGPSGDVAETPELAGEGAVALYLREVQRRHTRACVVLRQKLTCAAAARAEHGTENQQPMVTEGGCLNEEKSQHHTPAGAPQSVTSPPAAALAFLDLAEARPAPAVPPPPPTSMQLSLYATQQRSLQEALRRWRQLQSHAASLGPGAYMPLAANTLHYSQAPLDGPAHKNRGKGEEGWVSDHDERQVGSVDMSGPPYTQFQRQLQRLREGRLDVQHTVDALYSAHAAATAAGVGGASATTTEAPATAMTQPEGKEGEGEKTRMKDRKKESTRLHTDAPQLNVVTPDETRAPSQLTQDTLLTSPPELAVEKTRPWVDSLVETAAPGGGADNVGPAAAAATAAVVTATTAASDGSRPTPATAEERKVRKKAAAPSPAARAKVEAVLQRLSRPSSPSSGPAAAAAAAGVGKKREPPTATPPAVVAAASASKARVFAAAAAAAARLLSSASSASEEEVEEEGVKVAVDDMRSQRSDTSPSPSSASQLASRAAAGVSAGRKGQESKRRTGRAVEGSPPCGAVDVKGEAAVHLPDRSGHAQHESKGGEAAAMQAHPSALTAVDDSYTSYTTSSEAPTSYESCSRSGSTGSDAHASKVAAGAAAGAHARQPLASAATCAASWQPHLQAALCSSSPERAAQAEGMRAPEKEEASPSASGSGGAEAGGGAAVAAAAAVYGTDRAVYDALAKWVAQQQEGAVADATAVRRTDVSRGDDDAGAHSSAPFSPAELEVITEWIRGRTRSRDGARHADPAAAAATPGLSAITEAIEGDEEAEKQGGGAEGNDEEKRSSPPAAVRRAVRLFFPEVTLPSASPSRSSPPLLASAAPSGESREAAAQAQSTLVEQGGGTADAEVHIVSSPVASRHAGEAASQHEQQEQQEAVSSPAVDESPTKKEEEEEERGRVMEDVSSGPAAVVDDETHAPTSVKLPPPHLDVVAMGRRKRRHGSRTADAAVVQDAAEQPAIASRHSSNKMVETPRRKSFFQKLFSCGGR